MNTELHAEVRPMAPQPVRREPVVEGRARVVEYVRRPHIPTPVEASEAAYLPCPDSPRPVLPWWLVRLLVAWGLITLATLVGPCRPPVASPALAAEAAP